MHSPSTSHLTLMLLRAHHERPEKLLVPCVITALLTPVLGRSDISRETLLMLSRSIACVWLTDRFGFR